MAVTSFMHYKTIFTEVFIQLKWTSGPRARLLRFNIKCAKYSAPNWFDCHLACSFLAKSGKYCYNKRGKLMQL